MSDPINEMPKAIYGAYTQSELDRAYDQRAWAANAEEVIARYLSNSAAAREVHRHHVDLAYGTGPQETLDWFPAATPGGALHIHIHGGAWRLLAKSHASYVAPPFLAAGVHYVAPDFVNLPSNTIAGMIDQLVRAVRFVHDHAREYGGDPARIFLSGHSSGAHLAAVLLTHDWHSENLPRDLIKGAVLVSGIYDLEPVLLSSRRSYVILDDTDAHRFSPALHAERISAPIVLAYGGRESPEFVRQTKHFASALSHAGKPPDMIYEEGQNHFEVAEEFARSDSAIMRAALAQIAAQPLTLI